MKTCTQCRLSLPLTAFHKRARAKDGLQPYCRQCAAKIRRRHYLATADEECAYSREYYHANRP